MRISFVLLVALLFFSSCSDLDKTEQQKQVGVLQKTTDSLSLILNKEDLKSINVEFDLAEELLNNLAQLLENDTVSETQAKNIASLTQTLGDFSSLELRFKELSDELNQEQNELKKLSSDIDNGNGKRNKYNSYINFEKDKIKSLNRLINEFKKLKTEINNRLVNQKKIIINDFYFLKLNQQQ